MYFRGKIPANKCGIHKLIEFYFQDPDILALFLYEISLCEEIWSDAMETRP